jgi:hypothetical protein
VYLSYDYVLYTVAHFQLNKHTYARVYSLLIRKISLSVETYQLGLMCVYLCLSYGNLFILSVRVCIFLFPFLLFLSLAIQPIAYIITIPLRSALRFSRTVDFSGREYIRIE